MLRKIDIGIDKNLHIEDPKAKKQPQLKFLADDIPKSPDEAIAEARKAALGQWINSEPLLVGHTDESGMAYLFAISDLLRKKVVLLEITDFCLLPCRRSLSYSLEWHKRYGHSGLLVISVHSPMFEFAKDKKFVMDAARYLGIPFPIVLDNDFHIWRSLENRFWPRRILLDNKGTTHADITGEGNYEDLERCIQLLLRDLSPGLPCPPVLKPLRRIDDPGYDVPDTTSEIFLGTKKNMRMGNKNHFKADNEEVVFKNESTGSEQLAMIYFEGGWLAGPESVWGTPHKGDVKLTVRFSGTDAYVVARSRAKNPADSPQGTKVKIEVDHKSLTEDKVIGTDTMLNEVRRSVLVARDPKLYHLATKLDPGIHELTLTVDEDSLHTIELYGLFFEHNS